MIELNAGCILVDDIDISTLPREAVRGGLIAIPQEPFFLPGTVRLNADPFGNSTDEAITEALIKVGLWDNLGGLDIEFDIDMLSHGQRQLFCLSRAILCESKIVVLDEATSSVDADTDKLMQRLIREEFAGRTIISVAHRLGTILDFDRIAVLQEGVIIEYDSPKALLSRQSAFKALYDQSDSRNGVVEGSTIDAIPNTVEENTWDENEVQTLPSDQTTESPRNEVEDTESEIGDGEFEVGEFQANYNQQNNYAPQNVGNEEEEWEDDFAAEEMYHNDEGSEEGEGEEQEQEETETATGEGKKRESVGWLRRMISSELLRDSETSGSPNSFEGFGSIFDRDASTPSNHL